MKTDTLDRDNITNEEKLFKAALLLNSNIMGFSFGLGPRFGLVHCNQLAFN